MNLIKNNQDKYIDNQGGRAAVKTEVFGVKISEINKLNNTINRIQNNYTLKTCYNTNPKTFTKQLAIFMSALNWSDYSSFSKTFDMIEWDLLFGSAPFDGVSWSNYGKKTFLGMLSKKKKKKHMPDFVVLSLVKDIINDDELVIKSTKQTLKHEEIAFVGHQILTRILNNPSKPIVLSRNYFLKSGFKSSFKKKTNRNINSHKIARIIKLLDSYNIVKCIKRYDYDTKKRRPNEYSIGDKIPMIWLR